jgi:protein arginine kinase
MVEVELQTQKTAFHQEGIKLQDRICRTLGTLKTSRIMTLQEALDGLSALRVGVERKILKGIDLPSLNRLLILIQPAHLAKVAARELKPEETSMERARLLGTVLRPVEPVEG